jgi:HK97 family phage major capsid protein
MPASLTKIDERLSAKRRALATLISERQTTFDSIDALAEEIDALEAKAEPTAEDAEALKAKHVSLKAAAKQSTELADKINAAGEEISTLESQKHQREDHNRQSANLVLPQNRIIGADSGDRITVKEASKDQLDHDISSFFRNSYIAKKNNMSIAAVCSGEAGVDFRNDSLYSVMTKTSDPSVLPSNYVPRLIELLRPATVVRRMAGLNQIPLPNGNLRMPRQSAASTAAYTAEQANIAISDAATDQITLSAKKLTAMVPQSGELMRHSNPTTDAMIRNDVIRVISLTEDVTFIRAAGSSTVPKGLKAFADAASSTQLIRANATVNVANVTADLGKLLLALANSNCPMLNPYFIMHPRSERWLMDARDGNGNYAFPEVARGQLRGVPYLTTTQIPVNLTVDSQAASSEIYLVDASEFIIADTDTFELNVSIEAAYWNGSAVIAAFSQDTVLFRCIVEHDTAMRHNTSVAYLEKVGWGI